MKNLLIIVALLGISNLVNAQKVVALPKKDGNVIKFDPNKKEGVKTTWIFKLEKLPLKKNYTTDVLGRLNITFEVKEDVNKGQTLYFNSTMPIAKVQVSYGNENSLSMYNENTMTGYFYLESTQYKAGLNNGYKLLFYLNGTTEPVAEAQIIPLKSFK